MTVSIVPLSLVVTLVLGHVQSEPRLPYGASCPAEDWCDYGKWLWCHSNTCQCLHPHRQAFDPIHNRCVAVAGTECNVYIGDRDCTSNSFCDWHDGKGKCKCKPGSSQTPQRTCSKIGSYEEDAPSLPKPFAIAQNEIIDIPRSPVKLSSVKPEAARRPFEFFPSWTARTNYEGSGRAANFFIPRTNSMRSFSRNNSDDESESGGYDFMSSWRRLMSLLLANRNTRMFFR